MQTIRSIQVLLAILIILLPVGFYFIKYESNSISRQQQLQSARIISRLVDNARIKYSDDALAKFRNKHPVTVGHNHRESEDIMPNPATFGIELAQSVSDENKRVWMYSSYPFPWRQQTAIPKTDYEQKALDYLKENPEDEFVYTDGNRFFYATAVVMNKQSCVDCHNSHPDSPRNDWQVGDVRAVLATSSTDVAATRPVFSHFYILFTVLIVLTIATMLFLLSRLKLLRDATEKSHRDNLTGLYNRRFFEEDIEQLFYEYAVKANPPRSVALFMVDIDYFKRINDQHGHLIGDQCLKEVGKIIDQQVRDQDYSVRYGGDEFLIFLTDSNSDTIDTVAKRIQHNVKQSRFSKLDLQVTVTIGVCHIEPSSAPELSKAVEVADLALYEGKKKGRDQIVILHYPKIK